MLAKKLRVTALIALVGFCKAWASDSDAGAECTLPRVERAKAQSSECLACHSAHSSHQVGKDYATLWSSRFNDFKRPAELPGFVVLVDGKLACTTCHDGKSRNPDSLPVKNQRELCTACHVY